MTKEAGRVTKETLRRGAKQPDAVGKESMTNIVKLVAEVEKRVTQRGHLSPRHNAILAASAFATAFIHEADREVTGQESHINRAAIQLAMALHAIPDDEAVCKCGHSHFWHEGTTGGICLVAGCECGMFDDKEAK